MEHALVYQCDGPATLRRMKAIRSSAITPIARLIRLHSEDLVNGSEYIPASCLQMDIANHLSYSKHMDKHDRPYKCMEPGCDKIQGFTYSGGLLRHQREVHKKNATTKKALMCPYADCNRSTGNGFTRQENLKEHLRRRHMHTEGGNSPELPVLTVADVEGLKSSFLDPTAGLKRKHDDATDPELNGVDTIDESNSVDLHNEVKRLRREVEEKDRRLEELEKIVAGLQQSIPHHGLPVVHVPGAEL